MNFQRASQKERSLTIVGTDAGMEGGTRVSHCRDIDLWAGQVMFHEKRESYWLILTKSSCIFSAESSNANVATTEIFFFKFCFMFSVDFPEPHWTAPIRTFPDIDPRCSNFWNCCPFLFLVFIPHSPGFLLIRAIKDLLFLSIPASAWGRRLVSNFWRDWYSWHSWAQLVGEVRGEGWEVWKRGSECLCDMETLPLMPGGEQNSANDHLPS